MDFTLLPEMYQSLFLSQYSYVTKWFIFLTLICLSCYYLFVSWKDQKQSHFYTIIVFRYWAWILSSVYILASPLTIMLMSPEIDIYTFYNIHLILYTITLTIGGTTLLIDFFRYGIIGLLKLAGFNLGDEGSNKLASVFKNNKHFLKIAKNYKGGEFGRR